jgi:hypothetical protein
MADFFQPNQQGQQDPDAVRRMILARLMGTASPVDPNAPLAAPAGFRPTDMTPPATTPQPGGSPVAQPTSSAKSPVAKPMATPSTAVEPGNQPPLPTFTSEEEWNKANPAAPHTPYRAPDLKHRLLEGLFAGMQEFGRPGEGATTVRNYLGDIQKNQEAEQNYPETSAAAQHQRYMTYVQGARAPLDLQELQARINETQAMAAERLAKAKAEANPAPKYAHVVVDDPARPGTPKAALFDERTGAYVDPDTQKAIPGAKPFEKPAPPGNDFEQYYKQWMTDKKQPDTAANRLAAHKEWEIKPEQPGANDTRLDRSYQYNNNIVEKQRAPIDQRLERLDRVEQAVSQRSAQADALIAPELLSVMVGGQGSGLRMNEAEIGRIVGGRSKWADLQAVLQKWTPGSGLSVTPDQRQQISKLLKVVREKTEAKQRAYDDAQEALIHASSVEDHRKITAELKKKLSAIDSGPEHGQSEAGKVPANANNPAGI